MALIDPALEFLFLPQPSPLCNRHHTLMDNVNLTLVDNMFEKKIVVKSKKRCVASWCFLLICTGNL